MAKTTPADTATPAVEPDAIVVEAAQSALDAAARNPEYPGYEAVRDLYESYLRLHRRCDDLASMVETLKHDLAATRRGDEQWLKAFYHKQKALFFALEATEGTYAAPAASAFILTENFQVTPVVPKRDSAELYSDDTGSITVEKLATKNTAFTFDVLHSWPDAAPAAAAGFLAISPLLEVCGALNPAYTAGPPATLGYAEQTNLALIKSGSISFRRRRTATQQLERKSAGVRGSCAFNWEVGKIPRFSFDMVGGHLNLLSSASLTSAPGAQLTNLDGAANAATVGEITLGGKTLCLTKYTNKNLFRVSAEWVQFLCGERAQPKTETANDITVTFKMPNIDTDFNPDAYLNNEYPLAMKLLQVGGARTLRMYHPTVQVLDYKEVEIGDELGIEMTLRQTSRLTLTTE